VSISATGSASAVVANAFPLPVGSLESGGSCPGVTEACRDCYAANTENISPGFQRGGVGNLEALRHLYSCAGRRAVVDALVAVVEHSRREQVSVGVVAPTFRWHSGGDVFARWYATAIVEVCRRTASVDHWLYTRSLGFVRHLVGIENLRVFVSADRFNISTASRVAGRWGVDLAILADDPTEAVSLWGRAVAISPAVAESRAITCPVARWSRDGLGVAGHVVGADGRRASVRRSSAGVGACVACQHCFPGASGGVTFLLHGGKAAPGAPGRLGTAVAVRARRAVTA
jgi:hypothetical protein